MTDVLVVLMTERPDGDAPAVHFCIPACSCLDRALQLARVVGAETEITLHDLRAGAEWIARGGVR